MRRSRRGRQRRNSCPMKRRLFDILAAVSLVLWLLALGCFIRSAGYGYIDGFAFSRGGRFVTVESLGDHIFVRWVTGWSGHQPLTWTANDIRRLPTGPSISNVRGTTRGWGIWVLSGGGQVYGPGMPFSAPLPMCGFAVNWVLLLIPMLILPVLWLFALIRRRRRFRSGMCRACGYDLRAHHPGQRCPECGTPVPADHTAEVGQ